ncbi:MAG: GNAT family N-acetyltransferase [Gammaproteobacteria bacterium]
MQEPQAIHVRLADYSDAADAAAILQLMQAYARDPMGGGEALPQFTLDNLVASLDGMPGAFTLLAFEQQEAVGLMNCFTGFSTFKCKPLINIHDVIVVTTRRGRGIAGRMLQQVEAIARQRGCCKLTLEVLQGNLPAQCAYRKAGFAEYVLDPEAGHALFWEKLL